MAWNLWSAPSTLITFNYDTLIEEALSGWGALPHYGFTRETGYELVDPHAEERTGPLLLKLHGSVNWALDEKASKRIRVFRSYEELRRDQLSPHLVPPTWRKGALVSTIWAQAVRELRAATNIVILGYSIPATDLYFKHLLAAGMVGNASFRKIVLVNPDEGALERLGALLQPRIRGGRYLAHVGGSEGHIRTWLQNPTRAGPSRVGRPVPSSP